MGRRFAFLAYRPGLRRARSERGDPQRGDPITLLAQHFEAEAVKAEGLARLRNRARLMNDEPRHRGGFVVGQIPTHRPIELADGRRAVDHDRTVPLLAHALHGHVVLVANIADDLLDDVLKRYQPLYDAVLVDDQRRVHLAAKERLQLVAKGRRLGNEPRLKGQIRDIELACVSAGRDIGPEQILGVEYANDIVRLAAPER